MKERVVYCLILGALAVGAFSQPLFDKKTMGAMVRGKVSASTRSGEGFPILQHADVPLYPVIAKTAKLSGIVRLHVTVRDGRVVSAEPKSTAHQVLVNAATENVKTWTFAPDTNFIFDTTYVYVLEKQEVPAPESPNVEMSFLSLVTIKAKRAKPTCNDCGADVRPNRR